MVKLTRLPPAVTWQCADMAEFLALAGTATIFTIDNPVYDQPNHPTGVSQKWKYFESPSGSIIGINYQ